MRKILLTFIIGLTFISCQKEDIQPNQPTTPNTNLSVLRLTKDGQICENSSAVYYSSNGFQGLSPNQLDTVGIWQPQTGWIDVDTSKFIQINIYDTPSNAIYHYKVEYIDYDTTVLYEIWTNPDYQIVIHP